MSYHLPDVREQPVSKVLCGFDGQLSGQVVNGAHEDPVALHTARTECHGHTVPLLKLKSPNIQMSNSWSKAILQLQ